MVCLELPDDFRHGIPRCGHRLVIPRQPYTNLPALVRLFLEITHPFDPAVIHTHLTAFFELRLKSVSKSPQAIAYKHRVIHHHCVFYSGGRMGGDGTPSYVADMCQMCCGANRHNSKKKIKNYDRSVLPAAVHA